MAAPIAFVLALALAGPLAAADDPLAGKKLIEWGWDLADFSKNHFTPAEFEAAVRAALARSDGHVWIYTEKPRWWTGENLPVAYREALAKARKQ